MKPQYSNPRVHRSLHIKRSCVETIHKKAARRPFYNKKLFLLFGDFGNGIIIQRKPDPISQFLFRSDGVGIHEYIAPHRLAREIHRVTTLHLHHFVIDSRIKADHHPFLFYADTHFVFDHKAKATEHFLFIRDLVCFANELTCSTGQYFIVCHRMNFNYITGRVIFLPDRCCFQGFQ